VSGWRKAEREFDLGAKVHEMKQRDPDLNLSQIASRLGYSSSRVSQVYGKWRRERGMPVQAQRFKSLPSRHQ